MTAAGSRDQIVLVHTSDLHIGTSLMTDADDFISGLNSGYNPHDHRLLPYLADAIADGLKLAGPVEPEALRYVMGGDLTQGGLDNDYATAFALLHEQIEWRRGPRSRTIGLGWPVDRVIMVPGNHDHWRHKTRQTAYTRGLAPDWFVATPWRHDVENASKTLRLEIYGVDSNSGLEGKKPSKLNVFAKGVISDDEFLRLESELKNAPARVDGQGRVRVLLCHHAFSSNGLFGARPLVQESRERLLALAARHDISTVLTGHTHEFHEEDWPIAPASTRTVKELRCATTLQGTRKNPGLQGFWIHRLIPASSSTGAHSCEWTTWKYQFSAGRFELDNVNPVPFSITT